MTVPTPLSYAPRPRASRRKRITLVATVLVVALSITYATVHERVSEWWSSGWTLYYQRNCLKFTDTPGQVAYSSDPALLQALQNDPRYERVTQTRPYASTYVTRIATPWRQLYNNTGTASFADPLVVHEIVGPSGEHRLILVQVYSIVPQEVGFAVTTTSLRSFRPANLPATYVYTDDSLPFEMELSKVPLTIFAAECDKDDPGRFTIPYRLGDAKGEFTVRLVKNSSWDFTLEHTSGPLKRR